MSQMRVEMYLPIMAFGAAEEAKEELLSGAGGSTSVRGLGSWVDDEGETIAEHVDIVTVFVEDNADNRLWIEAVARKFKADGKQECVLYVINQNETFFIED